MASLLNPPSEPTDFATIPVQAAGPAARAQPISTSTSARRIYGLPSFVDCVSGGTSALRRRPLDLRRIAIGSYLCQPGKTRHRKSVRKIFVKLCLAETDHQSIAVGSAEILR